MDLSQADLAAQLGVKQQQVSKWESGTATPGVGRLPALASALGVDANEVFALVAEAAQAEVVVARQDRLVARQDRDSLVARFERFADKYEELGHTYRSNQDMLEHLVKRMDSITRTGERYVAQVDKILTLLEQQESRLAALEQRSQPPSGGGPPTPGRRTGRR